MAEESEQLFLDLEQRHVSLKKEHDMLRQERDSIRDKLSNVEKSLIESRDFADKLQREILSKDSELKQRESSLKECIQMKDDVAERLKRRSDECERLREDLKSQADELSQLRSRHRENQTSLAESQSQLIPLQYNLSKANREVASLKAQVEDYENDIEVLRNENATMRNNFANQQFEHKSALSVANASAEDQARKIQSLQDQLSLREQALTDASSRIRDLELRVTTQESEFSREMDGLKKMAQLYKTSFEESISRNEELEQKFNGAEDAFKNELSKLTEKCNHEIDSLNSKWRAETLSAQSTIEELRDQLRQTSIGSRLSVIPADNDDNRDRSLNLSTSFQSPIGAMSPSLPSPQLVPISDFQNFSQVEMYDRVVKAERALVAETNLRKRCELNLERIMRDIETKAPIIAQRNKEYQRVLESHGQLTNRVEQLFQEGIMLKERVKILEKAKLEAIDECVLAKAHSSDLSNQLQHLLKKYYEMQYGEIHSSSSTFSRPKPGVALIESGEDMSSALVPSTPDGVISTFLVTFDDIQDLQVKNAQLLQVVRKLSRDQERAEEKESSDAQVAEANKALSDALRELVALRDARQRTEDMVIGLVQQRDMYKAMLDETRATQVFKQSTSALTDQLTSPVQERGTSVLGITTSTSKRVEDLLTQVADMEDDARRMKDRSARLEEAERLLNQALEQSKQENITLKIESAKASSEATFQRERAQRLEESLRIAQGEIALISQRKLDVEKELLETQRLVRQKEDSIFSSNQTIKSQEDVLRRLQVELDVSRAGEARLITQLAEQREEIKRQMSLTESIQRIEAGLASRIEEEKASLQQERDHLVRSLETLRKQMSQRELVDDQRIRTLEDELKSTQTKLSEKSEQLSLVQQDLAREQSSSHAAAERANILDRQLTVVNERLTAIHGSNTLESVLNAAVTEKEVALEKAVAEIEALTSKLQVAESHADQFRQISIGTEKTLRELQQNSEASRRSYEEEVSKMKAAVSSFQEELSGQRLSTATALKEVEEARERQRDEAKEHSLQVKKLEESLAEAEKARTDTEQQLTLLKGEIARYQEAAKQSYANYERELQLHAYAEKMSKTYQEERDKAKHDLAAEQNRTAELSAAAIRRELAYAEERSKLESASVESKQVIDNLRHTNDLLHGQVQSLGVQVERLLEGRTNSALLGTSATGGASTDSSTTTAGLEDELRDLRNTSSELREVVRYIKRERDILEAKLSVIETENARYLNNLHILQRALDEVKIELKKETERKSTLRSEEDFSKLMAEVTQLNLIRESNAHLRYENEELSKRLHGLSQDIEKERIESAPLKESIRQLTTEKEALDSANQSLLKDSQYWRDRLHQLVARYNDVDPEEHRLLQEKCELLSKEKNDAETAYNLELAAQKQAYTTKESELTALKATYERLEKNAGQLRDRARDFKAKSDEQAKKIAEVSQQNLQLDGKVAELTQSNSQLSAKITELTQQNTLLNQRVKKLSNDLAAVPVETTQATSVAPLPLIAPPPTTPPQYAQKSTQAIPVPTLTVPAVAPPLPLTAAPTPAVTPLDANANDKIKTMREVLLKKQREKEKELMAAQSNVSSEPAYTATQVAASSAAEAAEDVTPVQATKKARMVPKESVASTSAGTTNTASSMAADSAMITTQDEESTSSSAPTTTFGQAPSHPSSAFSSFGTNLTGSASVGSLNPFTLSKIENTASLKSSPFPGLNSNNKGTEPTFEPDADSFNDNSRLRTSEDDLAFSEAGVVEEEGEILESGTNVAAISTAPTTGTTTSGPFLNLRPPSPSTTKDLVPVFGKKQSVVVPTLSGPSTTSTINTTANETSAQQPSNLGAGSMLSFGKSVNLGQQSPFSIFSTPTTTIGSGSAVIPKVMGSSTFGFQSTGVFGQQTSSVPSTGTPGGIFGASFTGISNSTSTTSSLFPTSQQSPRPLFSTPAPVPLTATAPTASHESTANISIGAVVATDEPAVSPPQPTSNTSAEGSSAVKLIGKTTLSLEEQKRRRQEKFAGTSASSIVSGAGQIQVQPQGVATTSPSANPVSGPGALQAVPVARVTRKRASLGKAQAQTAALQAAASISAPVGSTSAMVGTEAQGNELSASDNSVNASEADTADAAGNEAGTTGVDGDKE